MQRFSSDNTFYFLLFVASTGGIGAFNPLVNRAKGHLEYGSRVRIHLFTLCGVGVFNFCHGAAHSDPKYLMGLPQMTVPIEHHGMP